jgi:Protein of unknown function (DUF2851)
LNNCLKERVTKKQVTEMWQKLLNTGYKLKTESGQSLNVIYPGKTSDRPGSDFQDAVITIGGQTVKGNIEVHVKSGDWRTHGHHRNPAYNSVVLHVVMWHDRQDDIELQNGMTVPTLIIGNHLINKPVKSMSNAVRCSGIAAGAGERFLEVLDKMGMERFSEKAAQFQSDLGCIEAGQCLYSGIMRALGYTGNKEAFLLLAKRMPLSILELLASQSNSNAERLRWQQALLMGTAGLLPSQRSGDLSEVPESTYVNELEGLWQTARYGDVMSVKDWQTFHVRPGNSPLRRMVGMSLLLQRYQETGLLNGLVRLIQEVTLEKSHSQLEIALMVRGDDYWTSHFDFYKPCAGLSSWLIGPDRAADIVINVLLPFTRAWSKKNGWEELAEKAEALFQSYPALATNTIERHMRTQFGLKGAQVNSARRQQGLLYLYKNRCTQGRCGECEVLE